MKYIHGDTLKVGYVPTRRYMYDPEYAWEERDAIEKKVQELSDDGLTELVKIEWLNEEKLLKDVDDVERWPSTSAKRAWTACSSPTPTLVVKKS